MCEACAHGCARGCARCNSRFGLVRKHACATHVAVFSGIYGISHSSNRGAMLCSLRLAAVCRPVDAL